MCGRSYLYSLLVLSNSAEYKNNERNIHSNKAFQYANEESECRTLGK